MSSIGTGYDLAASTFSPDGRIFQGKHNVCKMQNLESNLIDFQSNTPSKLSIAPERVWLCVAKTALLWPWRKWSPLNYTCRRPLVALRTSIITSVSPPLVCIRMLVRWPIIAWTKPKIITPNIVRRFHAGKEELSGLGGILWSPRLPLFFVF